MAILPGTAPHNMPRSPGSTKASRPPDARSCALQSQRSGKDASMANVSSLIQGGRRCGRHDETVQFGLSLPDNLSTWMQHPKVDSQVKVLVFDPSSDTVLGNIAIRLSFPGLLYRCIRELQ